MHCEPGPPDFATSVNLPRMTAFEFGHAHGDAGVLSFAEANFGPPLSSLSNGRHNLRTSVSVSTLLP